MIEEKAQMYAAILTESSYHYHGPWETVEHVCTFKEFRIAREKMKVQSSFVVSLKQRVIKTMKN